MSQSQRSPLQRFADGASKRLKRFLPRKLPLLPPNPPDALGAEDEDAHPDASPVKPRPETRLALVRPEAERPAPRERAALVHLVTLPVRILRRLHAAKEACCVAPDLRGCVFWSAKASARYPEARISDPEAGLVNNTVYLHQLAAVIDFLENRADETAELTEELRSLPPKTVSAKYTCSHRCHTSSKCFSIGHIRIESQEENNSRQRCKVTSFCGFCRRESLACRHSPVCIDWLPL